MDENSFYWTLISDNLTDSSNTVSSFNTRPNKPLDLGTEKWEVGLVELVFPVSWYNFKEKETLTVFAYDRENVVESFGQHSFDIEEGHYTVPELIDRINDKIYRIRFRNTPVRPYFDINPLMQKVIIREGILSPFNVLSEYETHLKLNNIDHFSDPLWQELDMKAKSSTKDYVILIHMSDRMRDILGFSNMSQDRMDKEITEHGFVESDTAFDLETVYKNVYVYTNIINYAMVGETLSPLLRVVPVEKDVKVFDQQHCVFNPVFYHKVSCQYITSVNISLRDLSGELFSFRTGRSVCTLHFRKIKQ